MAYLRHRYAVNWVYKALAIQQSIKKKGSAAVAVITVDRQAFEVIGCQIGVESDRLAEGKVVLLIGIRFRDLKDLWSDRLGVCEFEWRDVV